MHELGIAIEIMDIAVKEMMSRNLRNLEEIGVKIGALSGIEPESLVFSFDASKSGTALEQTRLQIEFVPVTGHCESCGKMFQVVDFLFICPHCGSGEIAVEEGEEMQVTYLIGAGDD